MTEHSAKFYFMLLNYLKNGFYLVHFLNGDIAILMQSLKLGQFCKIGNHARLKQIKHFLGNNLFNGSIGSFVIFFFKSNLCIGLGLSFRLCSCAMHSCGCSINSKLSIIIISFLIKESKENSKANIQIA